MATRGSTTDASDEVFDYSCTPCSKQSKNFEAVKFCVDCQEYLCANCFEHHNKFSALAGHTLVERSKFGKSVGTDTKKTTSAPTERCKLHPLKLVDMYCADHDSVGCHVCFTINHKPCQGIHYIPEYVQTRPLTEDFRKVKEEMGKAISEINLALKSKRKTIEENRKSKSIYLEEIKAFRKEINETLDRLEKASVTKVIESFEGRDQEFQEELKAIENTLQSLAAYKAELESSQGNQSQKFVKTKLCDNLLSNEVIKVTESKEKPADHIHFDRNSEILLCLQNLVSLVKQTQPRKQSLYEIASKASYNVKLSTDARNCDIWSSCILDCGTILLADYRNGSIKLVDGDTYRVQHSLKTSCAPLSVCKTSSVEAAVSLDNNTVLFVSTKNKLQPTRSLKFEHSCCFLAVMDGQLVVCENNEVHIYTMNGRKVKTFDKDQSGSKIFSVIREVCVSVDGLKIHIVDRQRGLITIDGEGNVVWKYSGQELKNAWDVCTDRNGNVFVSSGESKNVVQLGHDGKYLGEVVSKTHGMTYPQALSFDKERRKLIVADQNKLHVFHVQ